MTHREGGAPADASTVVIRLDGELDAADDSWVTEVREALDAGFTRIVLDMLNVTFVDSSVVRELLLLHRRMPPDGRLQLVYTHHLIRRVITIVGLDDLFPQYSTVEAAVRESPARSGRESTGPVSGRPDAGHTDHSPGHQSDRPRTPTEKA